MKMNKSIVVAGKRKTSIAKATIKKGSGKIIINRRDILILPKYHQIIFKELIELTNSVLPNLISAVDISINVKGGGKESQIQASKLAMARALVLYSKNKQLRDVLIKYDKSMITADTRRKEQCKPNISKARKKRQKSYR